MEVLRITKPEFRHPMTTLFSLLRGERLVLSESPQVALVCPKPPIISYVGDQVRLVFPEGAAIEIPGKDLDVRRAEVTDTSIKLYTEWIFGIDADIVIEW